MREEKTIYYCDRCKKQMEYTSKISVGSMNPPVTIEVIRNHNWESADICPDCQKSFTEWWKGGTISGQIENSEEEITWFEP